MVLFKDKLWGYLGWGITDSKSTEKASKDENKYASIYVSGDRFVSFNEL